MERSSHFCFGLSVLVTATDKRKSSYFIKRTSLIRTTILRKSWYYFWLATNDEEKRVCIFQFTLHEWVVNFLDVAVFFCFVFALWQGEVVITAVYLHSLKSGLNSAYVQILFAACRSFVMVITYSSGPGLKALKSTNCRRSTISQKQFNVSIIQI